MIYFYLGYTLSILSFTNYVFRFFLLFLFFLFFIDTLALTLSKLKYNNAFYNLLSFLEFNLLFAFYKGVFKNKLTKKILCFSFYIYNIIYFFSSIFYGVLIFKTKLNTIAPVFGAFLIAIVLILYLREMLLSEEIVNYKKNIVFWITVGLLLYYLGTLPLTAIFNFMKSGSSFIKLYRIQHILTIIMHSCFLIGLLWSLKKDK
ncbi:hypothetical protein C7447_101710 [Tenacibaculum adriaticum]|uniref:Uncharacterized protein n=1 Tax=Tenacibaculum adriaticum TaxID=413713 RepID=A0A5S5DVU0_9FLAO|nr:hypothetical protein C7447_101710 [Tenacibaculum adriaticum]